jgi:hypothetical protein
MRLEIDETLDAVSFREARHDRLAMLMQPAQQIVRDADIERPVPVAGEDADITAGHGGAHGCPPEPVLGSAFGRALGRHDLKIV